MPRIVAALRLRAAEACPMWNRPQGPSGQSSSGWWLYTPTSEKRSKINQLQSSRSSSFIQAHITILYDVQMPFPCVQAVISASTGEMMDNTSSIVKLLPINNAHFKESASQKFHMRDTSVPLLAFIRLQEIS